jgi:peptidoglycan/LPS O-acetylase OafA/YrhL
MSTLTAIAGPDKIAASADSFYRPGLDILRVLAFFLVFIAHGLIDNVDKATQLGAFARSGEFGVCVFFFLSSYLITELLLREKRDTGSVAIPSFYLRRILRIWPLYFAVIGFAWVVGLLAPSHGVTPAWLAALLLLCANWYTVGHGYPPGFLFHLWSISLEEQFYLVWPWLAKYLGRGSLLGISSLIMGASYLTILRLVAHGQTLDPGLWVNSLVQFQFFALGTMTAILLRGRVPRLAGWVRGVLFVAGLLCMRAAQAVAENGMTVHDFAHIAPRFAVTLCGCLCLFFSLLPLRGAGKGQKLLVFLGKISYGLYVFHVLWLSAVGHLLKHVGGRHFGALTFQLVVMMIALPLTVVTGTLSYRYFESPFLLIKKRFTVVRSRPV